MKKLIITSLRKGPHSNYYAFEFKRDSFERLQKILNEINIRTPPMREFWCTKDKEGVSTNNLQPFEWFFDKHFYIQDEVDGGIELDIIFSQKLIHLIIFTKKDIQKKISDVVMKYSRIKKIK